MKMKTTLTVFLILELYGLSSGLFKLHFFVDQKMPWDSARQHCKTHYHDLSTFTNESEKQQFLADAIGQTSNAWVGLYKTSGVWKWIGGENATQINWDTSNIESDSKDSDYKYKGDKQADGKADCALLLNGHNKLHDGDCMDKYAFFCMNISEIVLVQQNESWEGALEYCRTHHNDLASLSSVNRMNSASGQITPAQTRYVWTGLRFLAGEWLWINGDDLDFTAWSQMGQPLCPATNLRCGALDKQTRVWTHRDCEEKLNFFCQ